MKREYIFLKAEKDFKKGETILNLGKTPCDKNDPQRIQIDANTFILPPQPIAHSCRPNSHIDWTNLCLVAKKVIKSGELISYHYGTSEDDYSIGAFNCSCGAINCLKYFRGYKYIGQIHRKQIKPYISPYLAKKYSEGHLAKNKA